MTQNNNLSVVPEARRLIEKGKNVMLEGPHGCGKSHTVRDISKQFGYTVAIFNCATMDPYIDFVGLPIPSKLIVDGVEIDNLKLVRPHKIDDADVIFFDEVNRALPETLNGVLEIAEERTINGEDLPKLKSVWAAKNPLKSTQGDYTVNRLDSAFNDRFDYYFKIKPMPDPAYIASRFGEKISEVAVEWWMEHHAKSKHYISPRRLVKSVQNFLDMDVENKDRRRKPGPDKDLFFASFDCATTEVDMSKLYDMLMVAKGYKKPAKDKKLSGGMNSTDVQDLESDSIPF